MSTRPDFSKVDFTAPCIEKETKEQWAARVKAETGMSVEELAKQENEARRSEHRPHKKQNMEL